MQEFHFYSFLASLSWWLTCCDYCHLLLAVTTVTTAANVLSVHCACIGVVLYWLSCDWQLDFSVKMSFRSLFLPRRNYWLFDCLFVINVITRNAVDECSWNYGQGLKTRNSQLGFQRQSPSLSRFMDMVIVSLPICTV